MDWSKIIPALESLAKIAEEVAPLAGPAGAAVSAGAAIAGELLGEAQAAGDVLSSSDLAKIQAATDSLLAVDVANGAKIDAS
jgi:hypothetical protein